MVGPDCVYDSEIRKCEEREDDPIFAYVYGVTSYREVEQLAGH